MRARAAGSRDIDQYAGILHVGRVPTSFPTRRKRICRLTKCPDIASLSVEKMARHIE